MLMKSQTVSIEQQATIASVSGNIQLIREGFFLPAQVGMTLLPGDRITSDIGAKAVVQFTGVDDALVVENGAAATFNIEVVAMDEVPQWIATDLHGEGVYFEETPELFGLFHTAGDSESTGSTGYPVLEGVVALGATAAILADNSNDDNSSNSTESGTSGESDAGTTTPPPDTSGPEPEPNPEPDTETDPQPGPLDVILTPVTSIADSLLGASTNTSPLSSTQSTLPASEQADNIANLLNLS